MVPQTQSFPFFEANQVLTSDQLNLLFEYNDEQNRLTRTNLIGIGIVCGLEATMATNGTGITITRGCGVTSSGYLVVLDPNTTYTYRKNYTQPDPVKYDVFIHKDASNNDVQIPLWELLTAIPPNNGDSSVTALDKNFLADKVVMLFVELNQTENKNCLPNSCDDKGATVNITIRPLLIKSSDTDTYLKTNIPAYTGKPSLPIVKMPRVNVTATTLTTTANLVDAYKKVLTKDFIQNTVKPALQQLVTTYKNVHNDINKLGQAINQLDNIPYDSGNNINLTREYYYQYYYDFISDLLEGYAEIISRYNRIMAVCCPDESWFPRHLLLNLLSATTAPDPYRHYFIPSPAIAKETQVAGELVQLFNRLTTMLYSFPNIPAPTLFGAPNIIITPSKLSSPLSEKSIPFYYSQTKQTNGLQLFDTWNYKLTQQSRSKQNLSYNATSYPASDDFVLNPLKYDLEPYNFFRIEGIVGTDYKKTLDTLSAMRNNNRLPFNVVGIRTGNQADAAASAYFPDLEANYLELQAAIACAGVDLLNSLANLASLNDTVIKTVIQRNQCLGKELAALYLAYTNRLNDLQQNLMLYKYGQNNPGITHKAGVPPGGTFIVVYDGAYQGKKWNWGDIFTLVGNAYVLSDDAQQIINSNPNLKFMTDSLLPGVTQENASTLLPIITEHINNVQVMNVSPVNVARSFNVSDTNINANKLTDAGFVAQRPNNQNLAPVVVVGHGSAVGVNFEPVAVTNGIIIADFYLPYICCANGGVSQYTVNETTTTTPPPSTCDKPCNGIVQQCLYPLWMPMGTDVDPNSEQIKIDIAYLSIRDDKGAIIYDEEFSAILNGKLNQQKMSLQTVKLLIDVITSSIKNNLKDTAAFTINYQPAARDIGTGLLQLGTYQCYSFELRISAETASAYYDYTYNNAGVNIITRYNSTSKLTFQEFSARIPKFGCVVTDLCQNKVITNSCQISDFKIKTNGNTSGGPENVTNLKAVYWIADKAIPGFGSDTTFKINKSMNPRGNLRAIVIDTNGCWAIDESYYPLG
ncbi:hypothetical protein [Chitinophaga sp. Cy-1792]|uniref:hypothetical protein n=1 Tax=Chitinophaga sp. Cy-1792 TaxID=2608339 RepID=UPI00141EBEED|nr:hypothetical protein [Chitinophaga sp. Cy-1792]NIG53821.1 hypothetical protein [Chitinophaga sp. Cy-1792]